MYSGQGPHYLDRDGMQCSNIRRLYPSAGPHGGNATNRRPNSLPSNGRWLVWALENRTNNRTDTRSKVIGRQRELHTRELKIVDKVLRVLGRQK